MIGMYDVDKSWDTDRMRMRGSGRIAGSSVGLLEVDRWAMRFISGLCIRLLKLRLAMRLTTECFRDSSNQSTGC
jgi:hypothetical protein